jgi:hypothetical protein
MDGRGLVFKNPVAAALSGNNVNHNTYAVPLGQDCKMIVVWFHKRAFRQQGAGRTLYRASICLHLPASSASEYPALRPCLLPL